MPREVSFFATQDEILRRIKSVTRRNNCIHKIGDIIWAVNKMQGLRKGEKREKLALLKVVSIREEPLSSITQEDVRKEGFYKREQTPEWFIQMYCKLNNCERNQPVYRIEFRYIEYKEARETFSLSIIVGKHPMMVQRLLLHSTISEEIENFHNLDFVIRFERSKNERGIIFNYWIVRLTDFDGVHRIILIRTDIYSQQVCFDNNTYFPFQSNNETIKYFWIKFLSS